MLLKKELSIKLANPCKKITCLCPAYDNSVVCVRVDCPGQIESLAHISQSGAILQQWSWNSLIGQFAMLEQKQVIAINPLNKQICLIKLDSQDITHIPHIFLTDDVHQVSIITFYKSKFFCIAEVDDINCRFRLSYFNSKQIIENKMPISTFLGGKKQWSIEHGLAKVNNHSKIAWLNKRKQKSYIQFHTWDLQNQLKGNLIKIVVTNTFGIHASLSSDFQINNLWQNKPDVYTLACISSIAQDKYDDDSYSQQNSQNLEEQKIKVYNKNYILDVKMSTIKETLFSLKDNDTGIQWNNYSLDTFNLQEYSVYHTYHPLKDYQPIPTFYIDNQSQKIFKIDFSKSRTNIKYVQPGYDPYLLAQIHYSNSNVTEIYINIVRCCNQKQILLHFMLHLNEDFDDDLLQDAVQLLI